VEELRRLAFNSVAQELKTPPDEEQPDRERPESIHPDSSQQQR
jgi:hypothetical protein